MIEEIVDEQIDIKKEKKVEDIIKVSFLKANAFRDIWKARPS